MDKKIWLTWKKTKARNLFADMVRDNEPLVASVVTKMRERSNYHLASFQDDMMQAGRIGLMRAIEVWEPRRGAFGTCAWFWIRREIQRVIKGVLPINLTKLGDLPYAIQRRQEAYEAQFGEKSEPEEIGVPREMIEKAERERMKFFSPDDPTTETGDRGWEAFIGLVPDAEGDIDRARDMACLRDYLSILSPKERKRLERGKGLENVREYIEWRRANR